MKVIKKINNNAAICLDSQGHEIVAIGTGVGYPSVPYDLEDLSKIQRTFYDIDSKYIHILDQVPEKIFQLSAKIVDIFREEVSDSVSSNIIFTLADHIQFAIERTQKNIKIETPLLYEIQNLYENEYEIGLRAVKMIQKELKVSMPKSEAGNIALHLINAEALSSNKKSMPDLDNILNDITDIIGETFQIYINKNSFNYSRFASHFQYLMKRQQKGKLIKSDNLELYEIVKKDYPKTSECVQKIKNYLEKELNFDLNDEESLYLILHVNRLCVREDCNRKGITPPQ
ncbi:MAG: PRD domain-containing protein [Longibaculum sp.]